MSLHENKINQYSFSTELYESVSLNATTNLYGNKNKGPE